MDTPAVAAAFPFTSPDLPATSPADTGAVDGVCYGHNLGSGGLVFYDRFAPGMDNHNAVVLGRSGSGKSYAVKLELLRSLCRGVHGLVIDPEAEYTALAAAVGGTVIDLGRPGTRLNPFDLPLHTDAYGRTTAPADALIRQSLFLHTFIAVLAATTPTPTQRGVLDTAITATYTAAGITPDPATWTRPAPLLADLHTHLTHLANPTTSDNRAEPSATAGRDGVDQVSARQAAGEVAAWLHPFVRGAYAGLFCGATTTNPTGHLVVFTLRELPTELRPLATLLTLDRIWRTVTNPTHRRPRLVTIDEAWLLMAQPAGAEFVYRLAKSARKHWTGLTVATQDTPDLLGTDLGKAVITNAATVLLLRQSPQAIDDITRAFGLTDGEASFLLSADTGHALLAAGTHRAAVLNHASSTEHAVVNTTPRPSTASHREHPGWIHLPMTNPPHQTHHR